MSTVLIWPFEKLLELDIKLCWKVGNILLRKSDEVKNGQIHNQIIIRKETALRENSVYKDVETISKTLKNKLHGN